MIEIESSLGEKDREMMRKIKIKIGTERDRKGYSERETTPQSQRQAKSLEERGKEIQIAGRNEGTFFFS